jgi:hypothetical protein
MHGRMTVCVATLATLTHRCDVFRAGKQPETHQVMTQKYHAVFIQSFVTRDAQPAYRSGAKY